MRLNPPDDKTILSKSPLLISILAATVVFIISILIIEQRRNIKVAKLRLELSSEMKRINAHINDCLDDMYSGVAGITRMINDGGAVQNFDESASAIMNSNKLLNNLSLIPGGVIKYTYPERNKVALNKNILYQSSKEETAAALAAFHSKKIKIGGPFKNFENLDCIAARLPVFINGKFWGFSSAVIRLEELIRISGIRNSEDSKYKYSLSYISFLNNKEVFFIGAKPSQRNIYVHEEMSHVNWKLYVSSGQTIYHLFFLPALLSLLGSVAIGFFLKRWLERTANLEILVTQKDQQIADTEKEFKAIFENAPIGFAIIDLQTKRLSSANQKFKNIFGLEEKIFPDDTDNTSQDTFFNLLNKIPTIVNEHSTRLSGEYKYVTGSGEEIWTNYKLFALPTTSETNNKYVVIAEDVTEKIAAERKIKESEKKYRHLFDESPVALWEEDFSDVVAQLSVDGLQSKTEQEVIEYFNRQPKALKKYINLVKIKSINDECFRQYNYASKEELFENFHKTIAEEPNLEVIKKTIAAVCAGRHQFKSESAFYNAEGELRNSILSWQVIPGHEETYDQVILTTVDITDLKKSKEDLNKSMEILNYQNQRLLDFSYIVSHNLRSHASNIQSLSDLIISSDSMKEKDELTGHLHRVVSILGSTIEALNDVVDINADLNVSRQQIVLREAVEKTINVLRDKIKQKEGVILNNIPKEVSIFYNKAYIESILLNLISNSLKYSKPDVCPIVSVNYHDRELEKVLIVSDNGIGIDLEKNGHKLFGLFKTFTHNPESKGVGLYITKRQIETLGGRITVDSTVSVGTTFKIYFK